MLVLTRKRNERIDLFVDGKKITEISVLRIHGGRVHIGLTAPREVDFRRGELTDSDRPEGDAETLFAVDT